MYRTREELDAAWEMVEQRKQKLEERRQSLYNGTFTNQIDLLGQKVGQLQQEKQLLEERCDVLQRDNDRVYAGHRGLEEEINFLKYRISALDGLHESVVQGTGIHDGSLKKYKCMYPFERIEILPRGEVYTCCSSYVKHNYYIGNFYEQSFDEIWNSERALKMRYSVSNGNFEYCMENCKWLHKDNIENGTDTATTNPIVLRTEQDNVDSWRECYTEKMPRFITLTCDETCNLRCPTCRSTAKALKKADAEILYERLEDVLRPMLRDCELLGALGCGDLFASYALTKFYATLTAEEFPKLKLYIITNLQLLTPEKWEELGNLHAIPIRFGVSVDAVNEETYKLNRRGGDWKRLLENLSFLREWRKREDNNIEFLCLHFVVQENNFRQVEDFARFGEEYGADTVEFQRLGNWGTFSDEEFAWRNVLNPNHELHEEAVTCLRNVMEKEWKVKIVQNIL